MSASTHEYTKIHQTIHFKMVNFMLNELHLNEAVIKNHAHIYTHSVHKNTYSFIAVH